MNKFKAYAAPVIGAAFGISYLLIPDFAVSVNRLSEMLTTGATRGLMMCLYDSGGIPGAVVTAIVSSLYSVILPIVNPSFMLDASVQYFGEPWGLLIFISGALIGWALLYLFGAFVSFLICLSPHGKSLKSQVSNSKKTTKAIIASPLIILAAAIWPGIIPIATGILGSAAFTRESE